MGQLNFFDGEDDENPTDVQQAWDEQMNPSPTPTPALMDKAFPDMTQEEADAARARGNQVEQVRPMPTPERDVIPLRSQYHSDIYSTPEEAKPSILERLRRSELVNSLGKMHDLNREYTAPEKLAGKAFYHLGGGKELERFWNWLPQFDEWQRKRARAAMTARMDKVFEEADQNVAKQIEELRKQPGQVHGSEKFSKEQMDQLNQGLEMMRPQATARSTPEPKEQSLEEGALEWDEDLMRRMQRRGLEEGWPGIPAGF